MKMISTKFSKNFSKWYFGLSFSNLTHTLFLGDIWIQSTKQGWDEKYSIKQTKLYLDFYKQTPVTINVYVYLSKQELQK